MISHSDPLSTKKEFPAQARERLQWVLDTVREHQEAVGSILLGINDSIDDFDLAIAKWELREMHKNDRDALLVKGGILTDEQIKLLTPVPEDQQP